MMSELTESLRYCATNNSCEFCPRHKYQYDSVIACAEQMLNEAADTIENQNNLLDLNTQRCEALRDQLRDSNENYEKHLNEIKSQVPRWIPVTERLPELTEQIESDDYCVNYSKDVLIWSPMNMVPRFEIARYTDDRGWTDPYFTRIKFQETVTHWMPLPKPPDLT